MTARVTNAQAQLALIEQEERVNTVARKVNQLQNSYNLTQSQVNSAQQKWDQFGQQYREDSNGPVLQSIKAREAVLKENTGASWSKTVTVEGKKMTITQVHDELDKLRAESDKMSRKRGDGVAMSGDLVDARKKLREIGEELETAKSALRIEQGKLNVLKEQMQ